MGNIELPEIVADLTFEGKTPPQLTTIYLRWKHRFRELVARYLRVSRGSGGIWVEGNRRAYASVLFTRINVTAKSILQLLPDCKPRQHWDFSAVASLTRNLAEAYIWYFWLCEDEVDEDVRQGRFILLYCFDHGSRRRLFPEEEGDNHDEVMKDLEKKFDENLHLRTFDDRKRRDFLRGQKTPFIQDDVLDRMGMDKAGFRFFYRFFSQHTHTGPVAFLRLFEHDRGKGVETVHEKQYMIMALIFAHTVLHSAIEGHLTIFPDAEVRRPHLTDAEVAHNVECNQWRDKRRR